MRFFFVVYALALSFFKAQAFPDMIRHGYTSCLACHTSLVGGNLLNPYGRALSKEVLSQTTFFGRAVTEDDTKVLGGLETPEWLLVGGNIRVLQAFVESTQVSRGRFFIMQVDLDFSAQVRSWLRFFGSVGRLEPKTDNPKAQDFVTSPRYGVEFLLSDPNLGDRWAVRAGRFTPAYGILFPEHTLVTRSYLGFGPGQERFAAELAYSNDQTSVILTQIFSQASGNRIQDETGWIAQWARAFGAKSKVGLNVYESNLKISGSTQKKKWMGPFLLWGISQKTYVLADWNEVRDAQSKKGFVQTTKVGHELHQGLQVFGIYEFANMDMSKTDPRFIGYSVGTQWFPKPHWDLLGIYRREKNTAISPDDQDVVWLVGHYYL